MTGRSTSAADRGPAWRELFFPRPFELRVAAAAMQAWAADQTSPRIVLETRSNHGRISYQLGVQGTHLSGVRRRLEAAVPGIQITKPVAERLPITAAARLRLSTRHRALRPDAVEQVARQLHAVLAGVRADEHVVLQLVLGPRRIPLAVPNSSPSSVVMPWWQTAFYGDRGQVDPEKRAALRDKIHLHGFAATLRIGVTAATAERRGALIRAVFTALQLGEAPGLKARLVHGSPKVINSARSPLIWNLRINSQEAVQLAGWPISADDHDLPGLPPIHPRQVAPAQLAVKGDLIVADALAPGVTGHLGYSLDDAMRGTLILGPTGVGKTILMLNRIKADLEAGRGVIVLEPKDLVDQVLTVVPQHRRDDIVLVQPADALRGGPHAAVIGINPLHAPGVSPELVADGMLGVFRALHEDLGPRSTDILINCLNVLARHESASLAMIMPLLSNPGFRRSLTAAAIAADPITAAPFWGWYESLSDDARAQVTAPLANKLRPTIRPQLRATLGQRRPRISIREVLATGKVLLVPLQPGVIGAEAAEVLAAVVLHQTWVALQERVALPAAARPPVMIYVDEAASFLKISSVDLGDVLSKTRSLSAGWVIALQSRSQPDARMLAAFDSHLRNRIVFQLNAADARAMSAGQSVLEPEDFSSLPAFRVYTQLIRGNSVQPWASGVTLPPPKPISNPIDIARRSRERYARPLDEIEAGFAELLTPPASTSGPASGRRRRQP